MQVRLLPQGLKGEIMIQIGDLVRIKNCHLKATSGEYTHFSEWRKKGKFRGKNRIFRVVDVATDVYFSRYGCTPRVLMLDKKIHDNRFSIGRADYMLNEEFLVLHRRGKAS